MKPWSDLDAFVAADRRIADRLTFPQIGAIYDVMRQILHYTAPAKPSGPHPTKQGDADGR